MSTPLKWSIIALLLLVAGICGYCSGSDSGSLALSEEKIRILNEHSKALETVIDSLNKHVDSLTVVNDSLATVRVTVVAHADSTIKKGNADVQHLLSGKNIKIGCAPNDTTQMVALQEVQPIINDLLELQADFNGLKATDKAALAVKDKIIADKDGIIKDKDGIIKDKDGVITEKDKEIKTLKHKSLLKTIGAGAVAVGAVVLLIVK